MLGNLKKKKISADFFSKLQPWGRWPCPGGNMFYIYTTIVASSDDLCKQFGLRSGPTKCRA